MRWINCEGRGKGGGGKRWIEEIDDSFCIEEICGSAHGCSVKTIHEVELVCRLGTYYNV